MPTAVDRTHLKQLFSPRRIAVIGASDSSRYSKTLVGNLVGSGWADRLHLVNRRGARCHGIDAVRSCRDIEPQVDLAFVMVPEHAVLAALTDAAEAGIGAAIILSSGYGEAGNDGRERERQLVEHAERLGIVVLGPNMLGFVNFTESIPAAAIPRLPKRSGNVALLSQSGASAGSMVDFATTSGVGLSFLVTLGNESMVTAAEALDYLVDHEETRAIAVFLETVRDPDAFAKAARRALAAGKPIVALKAGSSDLAAATAAAHTGALVGDHAVTSAVFERLAIIQADTIEDMLLTAGAAAGIGELESDGIGVVSISGGACDILADRAVDVGANLVGLAASTQNALGEILPSFGTAQNPLDVTGAALRDPSVFTRSLDVISRDPGVGVVVVVNSLPWVAEEVPYSRQPLFNAIGAGVAAAQTPVVFVTQAMQPVSDYSRTVLDTAGIAQVIPGLRQSVFALARLAEWSARARAARTEVAPEPWRDEVVALGRASSADIDAVAWHEHAVRDLLERAGVPVVPGVLAMDAAAAASAARDYACPVALKVVSAQILHKTDIGGVRLGVSGEAEAATAFDEILAAASAVPGAEVEGVLVSPMRPDGVEILVGVARDPQWGLVLAVAIGGIFVEILQDSVIAPLPVSTDQARSMLLRLRGAALLTGARGSDPIDLDALAELVARLGALAEGLGERLEAIEVNPLRVSGGRMEALDGLVSWATVQPHDGEL